MTRPRLLDLFCCEGGAGMGYHLAGFDVVGVDIDPQPLYPFEFHQGDAMTWPLDGFDAVHASPPCKEHTALFKTLPAEAAAKHDTGWMLHATIARLREWGGPWVVENVEGPDLPGALTLCGKEFGLEDERYALKRHRQFVSNIPLMGAGGCAGMHGRGGKPIAAVYGDLSASDRQTGRGPAARIRPSVARARRLMGMPWASGPGLSQALPPAYTEFIGEQLLAAVRSGVAS
ncbi:DNA cytosine methyltransferase [Micromonospora chersina]